MDNASPYSRNDEGMLWKFRYDRDQRNLLWSGSMDDEVKYNVPRDLVTTDSPFSAVYRKREEAKVPHVPAVPDENYLDGIDWSEHPVVPAIGTSSENVGQQFIKRVTPLFDKVRKRPLGEGYSMVKRLGNHEYDGAYGSLLELRHNGNEVGHVRWDENDGYVSYLQVASKHRHMTSKLLQEAWDISRKRGGYGPAYSGDVNDMSGPIMDKFNPESPDFQNSEYWYEQRHEGSH